jgi:hypothetical protein
VVGKGEAVGGGQRRQPLGARRRRSYGIKPLVAQSVRPITTQVDTHRTAVGFRYFAEPCQRHRLELHDLGLVHLEHENVLRPSQPVRAGVEASCQDHHLAQSGCDDVEEEVVEEPPMRTSLLRVLDEP